MSTTTSIDVTSLLGLGPNAKTLSNYLQTLTSKPQDFVPEIKSYPDAVYFNYYALGLSLLFKPTQGYKPKTGLSLSDLEEDRLIMDGLDFYNTPLQTSNPDTKKSVRKAEVAFASHPVSPITLKLDAKVTDKDGNLASRPESFSAHRDSTGKDFVQAFGEPDRKGGGSGPSSGSIGIWCEWSKDGILVEFGGAEARGPQAWERGKDAVWRVISIFAPKEAESA
ncbi:hypothetical protein Moror_493 [Moniliophthora roreri MCA 2997]|uniref:Uncharacterized protein n=1 Tax=Moniliophthora roreri (strain MCA 2997) TaxID=1381753 RepID=V2XWA5_MONRO|nr:hypothetical protein Moror_493 [Moniliophthora roreri MCA 2997]